MTAGKYLGLDLGSVSLDAVVVDESDAVLWSAYHTVRGRSRDAVASLCDDLLKGWLRPRSVASFDGATATGSGKELVQELLAVPTVNEIVAHGTAAALFAGGAASVIEIGGQDSKFILVGDKGVYDYSMNALCAAGADLVIDEITAQASGARHGSPDADSVIEIGGQDAKIVVHPHPGVSGAIGGALLTLEKHQFQFAQGRFHFGDLCGKYSEALGGFDPGSDLKDIPLRARHQPPTLRPLERRQAHAGPLPPGRRDLPAGQAALRPCSLVRRSGDRHGLHPLHVPAARRRQLSLCPARRRHGPGRQRSSSSCASEESARARHGLASGAASTRSRYSPLAQGKETGT